MVVFSRRLQNLHLQVGVTTFTPRLGCLVVDVLHFGGHPGLYDRRDMV